MTSPVRFLAGRADPHLATSGPDIDFVIAGGPKCATTSVFAALEKHPQTNMAWIKEPHYFATDLPGLRQVEEAGSYQHLFRRSVKRGGLRGEGSVFYLYSREAIPAIVRANPGVRIIALVRNPIEVFLSLHNEYVRSLDEDEPDWVRAWELQDERARGNLIPPECKEPRMLQYREICSFGGQIERLMTILPEEQVRVVVFDDLVRAPSECFQTILSFLKLASHPRAALMKVNEFGYLRSRALALHLRHTLDRPAVKRVRLLLKPVLNRHGIRPGHWLFRANLKAAPKPVISPRFRSELAAAFEQDIRLLERVLGRSFEHWLSGRRCAAPSSFVASGD